ncbi:MAG TPA: extracellular solute-binding protein, partial [Clostridia bacterium]|nr:extracellular solute-binding protein [Clostridia bacterium]
MIIFILAICLNSGVFVSCAHKYDPGKPVIEENMHVRIFELRDAFSDRERAAQYRARAIRLETDYNIDIEYVGSGMYADLEKEIQAILAGKANSDILAVDSIVSHRLIAHNVFVPIDSYIKELNLDSKDHWNTQAMNASAWHKGKLFGVVPYESALERIKGMPVIVYNRDIVGDEPYRLQMENKWSLEAFRDLAAGSSRDGISGAATTDDVMMSGLMGAHRMGLVNYREGDYLFGYDDDKALNICSFLVDLTAKGLRKPNPNDHKGIQTDLFLSSKAGMTAHYLGDLAYLGKDAGIAVFPTESGKDYAARDDYFPVC